MMSGAKFLVFFVIQMVGVRFLAVSGYFTMQPALHSKVSTRWVIAQRWTHLLFLSYPVEPDDVQARLPDGLEVDMLDGRAWVSVVPFFMSHIRFPVTPGFGFVRLRELNLRTYVRFRGQPGIYFFTLDTDNLLGQWIGRKFFHLPYRLRRLRGVCAIKIICLNRRIRCSCERR